MIPSNSAVNDNFPQNYSEKSSNQKEFYHLESDVPFNTHVSDLHGENSNSDIFNLPQNQILNLKNLLITILLLMEMIILVKPP